MKTVTVPSKVLGLQSSSHLNKPQLFKRPIGLKITLVSDILKFTLFKENPINIKGNWALTNTTLRRVHYKKEEKTRNIYTIII